MCGGSAPNHLGHLARVKMELLRIVLQDALSEATKITSDEVEGFFVDDITALLKGKNREVAKKVMKKLKEEIEKKGLELSVTENGKERAR